VKFTRARPTVAKPLLARAPCSWARQNSGGSRCFVRVLGAVAVGESDSSMQEPPGQGPGGSPCAPGPGAGSRPDAGTPWPIASGTIRRTIRAMPCRQQCQGCARPSSPTSSRAVALVTVSTSPGCVSTSSKLSGPSSRRARRSLAGDPERAMTLAGHGLDLLSWRASRRSGLAVRSGSEGQRGRPSGSVLSHYAQTGLLATGRAGARGRAAA